MATREIHLEQARHNRRIAEQLLSEHGGDPYARQWAMTATFYAALHCMEAALTTCVAGHSTHVSRRRAILDPANQIDETAYLAYEQLQQWSENGRYRMQTFSTPKVRRALDVYLKVVTVWLGLDT